MFTEEYGRAPIDARELSGWVAKNSRPNTAAVAGFDITFSPVKSVSVLWALAPRSVAEKIEAAHRAAIDDALAWMEQHAVVTRLGRSGVRQVDVEGIVAARFTHRDSRAGDPDLHTHVLIANKGFSLLGPHVGLLTGSCLPIDSLRSCLVGRRVGRHVRRGDCINTARAALAVATRRLARRIAANGFGLVRLQGPQRRRRDLQQTEHWRGAATRYDKLATTTAPGSSWHRRMND